MHKQDPTLDSGPVKGTSPARRILTSHIPSSSIALVPRGSGRILHAAASRFRTVDANRVLGSPWWLVPPLIPRSRLQPRRVAISTIRLAPPPQLISYLVGTLRINQIQANGSARRLGKRRIQIAAMVSSSPLNKKSHDSTSSTSSTSFRNTQIPNTKCHLCNSMAVLQKPPAANTTSKATDCSCIASF